MEDFFIRVWTDLIGRTEGPMKLRLILQPLAASILAIRAGLRDAREGKPPYFWAPVFSPDHRRDLLRQGWEDNSGVDCVARHSGARWRHWFDGNRMVRVALKGGHS